MLVSSANLSIQFLIPKSIDVIYTDFEKAFDKVPHDPHLGLISKLKAYDIDSKLIVWIEDFLCNRKQ